MRQSLLNATGAKMPDLKELQNRLKIKLKPATLTQALTHNSCNEDGDPQFPSYERLEFLGDAVLGLFISAELYHKFAQSPEGELTCMKSNLVNAGFLAKKAETLGLGEYVIIGKNEDEELRKSKSILSDIFEALVGAIYLEQGKDKAWEFLTENFQIEIIGLEKGEKDSKSLLQEIIQKHYKMLPKYRVIKESGPSHKKIFWVGVWLQRKKIGEGEGSSKRKAEQMAAQEALKNLPQTLPELADAL